MIKSNRITRLVRCWLLTNGNGPRHFGTRTQSEPNHFADQMRGGGALTGMGSGDFAALGIHPWG